MLIGKLYNEAVIFAESKMSARTTVSLPTTVIGVYPKPDYLQSPVWYKEGEGAFSCDLYDTFMNGLTDDERLAYQQSLLRAQKEVRNHITLRDRAMA